MLQKTFRLKQVDETKGEIMAVIATLNVKDHDNDVTVKGAFGSQEAQIVPVHDWNHIPLGRASISEDGNDVVAKMRFNMDSEAGREWFKALKFDFETGNPLQEYSYGFEIVDSEKGEKDGAKVQFLKKLKVIEVSPVLLGAGINTRTVDVKARKKAYAEIAGSWEAIQRLLCQAIRLELNDDYCYVEATLDATVIAVTYRNWQAGNWQETYFSFDWTLGEDGRVTLSNRQEVSLDLVVSAKSLTFADQFDHAVGELKRVQSRSKALAALRGKAGRTLSQANRDRLSQLSGLLADAHADLDALLAETDTTSENSEGKQQLAEFQKASVKAALAGRKV